MQASKYYYFCTFGFIFIRFKKTINLTLLIFKFILKQFIMKELSSVIRFNKNKNFEIEI